MTPQDHQDLERSDYISLAIRLGEELKAHRDLYGAKSRERASVVRLLSHSFGMSQRDIGTALTLSSPRVCEIINGPKPRKKKQAELA